MTLFTIEIENSGILFSQLSSKRLNSVILRSTLARSIIFEVVFARPKRNSLLLRTD